MSEKTIYDALRSGGLSHAGACAMMGNMFCESALIPNNVEDRCTLGDFDYTYAVDTGTISRYQFKVDAFGYGLCQWTYPTRKEELYNLAKQAGVSIGDEALQCGFCVLELKRDYASLYQFLCTTEDVAKATEDICSQYERPAVNNFAARINAAQRFYNQYANDTNVGCTDDSCSIDYEGPSTEEFDIIHPEHRRAFQHLSKGDGMEFPLSQVLAWQALLQCWGFAIKADGMFGPITEEATVRWQKQAQEIGAAVEVNGIVDEDDWEEIIEILVESGDSIE